MRMPISCVRWLTEYARRAGRKSARGRPDADDGAPAEHGRIRVKDDAVRNTLADGFAIGPQTLGEFLVDDNGRRGIGGVRGRQDRSPPARAGEPVQHRRRASDAGTFSKGRERRIAGANCPRLGSPRSATHSSESFSRGDAEEAGYESEIRVV